MPPVTVIVAFTALRFQVGWNRHPIDSHAVEKLTAAGRGLLPEGGDLEQAVDVLFASG